MRVAWDDGTVTLCALRAATVLSRNCCADFGRPLTKKVLLHSRDRPGVTAPWRTSIVPLMAVWNTPSLPVPPLKGARSLLFRDTGGPVKLVRFGLSGVFPRVLVSFFGHIWPIRRQVPLDKIVLETA